MTVQYSQPNEEQLAILNEFSAKINPVISLIYKYSSNQDAIEAYKKIKECMMYFNLCVMSGGKPESVQPDQSLAEQPTVQ